MRKKTALGILLVGLLLLSFATAAYFSKSPLEGDAFAEVCACGLCRVTLQDGNIILAEPNHSNAVGFVNGTFDPAGTNVVLFVGGRRVSIGTERNHLGLRCVDPEVEPWHEYVVVKPRWKAYIHWTWLRITR